MHMAGSLFAINWGILTVTPSRPFSLPDASRNVKKKEEEEKKIT